MDQGVMVGGKSTVEVRDRRTSGRSTALLSLMRWDQSCTCYRRILCSLLSAVRFVLCAKGSWARNHHRSPLFKLVFRDLVCGSAPDRMKVMAYLRVDSES